MDYTGTHQEDTNSLSLSGKDKTVTEVANSTLTENVISIVSLEIQPYELIMKPESLARFTVTGKDSIGNLIDVDSKDLIWESSDGLIASIDSTGLITCKAEGISEIKVKKGELSSTPAKVIVNSKVLKPYPLNIVFPSEESLVERSNSSGLRVYFSKNDSGLYDLDWSSIRLFLNGEEITKNIEAPLCQDKLCGWVDFDAKYWFLPGNYTGEVIFKTASGEVKSYVWRFRIYQHDRANRPPEIGVWPPEDSRPFVLDMVRVSYESYPNNSLQCNSRDYISQAQDDWYESHRLLIDGIMVESKAYRGFDCIRDAGLESNPSGTDDLLSQDNGMRNVVVEYIPSPPLASGKHTATIEIKTHIGRLLNYEWDFEAP